MKWYKANAQYAIGRALEAAGKRDEAKGYFEARLATYQALLRSDSSNMQPKIEAMLANAQLRREESTLAAASAVEQYSPHHPGKLFAAACAYALLAANLSNRSTPPKANRHQDRAARESLRLLTMASVSLLP